MGTVSRNSECGADVLSRNPVESIVGEQVNCAIIRDSVLSLREQLIEEQRKNPESGLGNPEDSSVNAAICENWSRDFRIIEGLFYVKYATTLGEIRNDVSNDLPQFRKKVQTEETMMPSTSGYTLRPREGSNVKSRSANEKRTQQGGPVGNNSTAPTPRTKEGQAAGIPEEVSNNIARRE
ncbi:hypothetical protein TNCV_587881 [Trichonephila clavipes]|nr:hypothetical protein TNCV_587881 [Trichonephila clavipes]